MPAFFKNWRKRFFNSHIIRRCKKSVDAIGSDVSYLRQRCDDVDPSKLPQGNSSSRRIPSKPPIFHGRDALVSELADKLTAVSDDGKHAHIAILAAGGMGKTSLALAVMEDKKVVAKFREENCYWVPCDQMMSSSLLLDTLYSHLQVQCVIKNSFDNILDKLYTLSEPIVLLLDNFETPWASDAKVAENILRAIAKIPKVAIFLTMRGSNPPSRDIIWYPVPLASVDAAHSRQIYEEIYPKSRGDPNLPKLLEQLGHLPLAVTLMATLANKTKFKASKLLKDWDRIGPDLLESNSDSMSKSIQLSIKSKPINDHPDALLLLAILSMLPAGISNDELERWTDILSNCGSALVALRDTALAQQGEDTLFILPVIRSFVLHPGHISHDILHCARQCVQDACYKFLKQHKSSDPSQFKDNTRAVSQEESNLKSILLDAADSNSPDSIAADQTALIEGLLALCWHQYHTRPRAELIERTLELVKHHDKKAAIAEALRCYGGILFRLNRFDDAAGKLIMARDAFVDLNDKFNAALCSLKLILVYGYQQSWANVEKAMEEARVLVKDAQSPYLDAKYLLRHGNVLWMNRHHHDAIEPLNQAKEEFSKLDKPLDVAQSVFFLGECYLRLEMYDDARSSLDHALYECEYYENDGYVAQVLQRSADLSMAIGDYDGGFAAARRALEKYRLLGSPLGVVQSLQLLGKIWLYREEYDDARKAFQESLKNLELLPQYPYYLEKCHTSLAEIDKLTRLEKEPQPTVE